MNLMDWLFPWVALAGAGAAVLGLIFWALGGFDDDPLADLWGDDHG